MGSLNRWLGTNAKDLLCNTLLVWILQQLKQPSKLVVVEYVAKTLGSWTCNQTCLDALCRTRARDIVPILRVAMNMKDLEESTRARLVESAARIVGHNTSPLSVLLLRDFAETPTTATTAPSLIQALHKESDPKRLRVRSVRAREFERDTRSWNITRNNINRAFSLFLGYAIDRHERSNTGTARSFSCVFTKIETT